MPNQFPAPTFYLLSDLFHIRLVCAAHFLLLCFVTEKLPNSLAVYPLDKKRRGTDISSNENLPAKLFGIKYEEGPDGRRYGSTQFYDRTSYVEIPNTGKLDAEYSITLLIWVNNRGRYGNILRYKSNKFKVRMISSRVLEVVIQGRTRRKTVRVQTPGNDVRYKAWNYIGVTYDYGRQLLTIWVNSKPVVERKIGKVRLDTRKNINLGGRFGGKGYFLGRLFCLQLYSVPLSRRQIEQARKRCFLKGKFVISVEFFFSVCMMFIAGTFT